MADCVGSSPPARPPPPSSARLSAGTALCLRRGRLHSKENQVETERGQERFFLSTFVQGPLPAAVALRRLRHRRIRSLSCRRRPAGGRCLRSLPEVCYCTVHAVQSCSSTGPIRDLHLPISLHIAWSTEAQKSSSETYSLSLLASQCHCYLPDPLADAVKNQDESMLHACMVNLVCSRSRHI